MPTCDCTQVETARGRAYWTIHTTGVNDYLYDYREKLIRERHEGLRLRCYMVLSVEFDRILWEEIEEQIEGHTDS